MLALNFVYNTFLKKKGKVLYRDTIIRNVRLSTKYNFYQKENYIFMKTVLIFVLYKNRYSCKNNSWLHLQLLLIKVRLNWLLQCFLLLYVLKCILCLIVADGGPEFYQSFIVFCQGMFFWTIFMFCCVLIWTLGCCLSYL